MAPEVGALSVSIDTTISGTWYADVIFNSAFPYQSVDDVFAIALHEAGNVFGLEDNNDPNSPLMAGPIPTATTPTANDIANLQALHGVRDGLISMSLMTTMNLRRMTTSNWQRNSTSARPSLGWKAVPRS